MVGLLLTDSIDNTTLFAIRINSSTDLVDGRANHFVTEQRSAELDFLTHKDAKGSNHGNTAVFQLSLAPFANV